MRELQIVYRRKPRPKAYLRAKPEPSSPYQRTAKHIMKWLAELSGELSLEEVAMITGCQIYDRDRNLLLCGGEPMPKTAALVKHYMRGLRIGRTRKPRKWEQIIQDYIKRYESLRLLSSLVAVQARREQPPAPTARLEHSAT